MRIVAATESESSHSARPTSRTLGTHPSREDTPSPEGRFVGESRLRAVNCSLECIKAWGNVKVW